MKTSPSYLRYMSDAHVMQYVHVMICVQVAQCLGRTGCKCEPSLHWCPDREVSRVRASHCRNAVTCKRV